ncbi:MAG: NDP-sugar synthase [Armatimonadota bacterium]|nr:NDP-sugar synthase [Armatimonadota bacterium]MCX7777764.1 NDP-sugar synthase [Armatimonadota bacterium]MDW8025421.1 NDP-sugar synthase [Armatimonadota bacterium]
MQALVLVGGYGTRLRPLTYDTPKAMAPIVNVPFIEHMMHYLKINGVKHVILTLCYLPEQIKRHLEQHDCGIKVDFIFECKPLGTGGAIKNAEQLLEEEFLVFNGDIITTIDLRTLVTFHREHDASVTIALTPVDNPSLYGVVVVDTDGRVKKFVEKPPIELAPSNMINAGIYVYRKDVLRHIPYGVEYSVERQLYPKLLEECERVFAIAFPSDYWIDIGSIDKYMKVNFDILDGKLPIEIEADEISTRLWAENGAKICSGAKIIPPALIGTGSMIEDGACIGPYAILGRNVHVKSGAFIEHAIVWDGCKIGRNAKVCNTVLGYGCKVEDEAVATVPAYACNSIITQASSGKEG